MAGSPAQSLFASDYSLSAPNTPASARETPSSHTRLTASRVPASPSPLRQKAVEIPRIESLGISTALPTPPISPVGDDDSSPVDANGEGEDVFTAELPKTVQKKASVAFSDSDAYYTGTATVVPTPTGSAAASTRRPSDVSKSSAKTSRKVTEGYEGAMEGEFFRSDLTVSGIHLAPSRLIISSLCLQFSFKNPTILLLCPSRVRISGS